jgi:hypothetical protein
MTIKEILNTCPTGKLFKPLYLIKGRIVELEAMKDKKSSFIKDEERQLAEAFSLLYYYAGNPCIVLRSKKEGLRKEDAGKIVIVDRE